MTKRCLPIIILAAGTSSRMRGRDKLLEDVDGVPLLRSQVCKALKANLGPVLVALPPAPHARYAALAGLEVALVPVADAQEGMNASLRAAFAAVPIGAAQAMLLLADLPDITTDDLHRVANAVAEYPKSLVWRGVTADGAPGHPIVFDATLFNAFQQLTGDEGGQSVIQTANGRITLVPLHGDRARRDLDTPEDWAAWRATREG
ncbi:4-diphosphocytidyl-2C-methyl-D-erythritol synthase [Sulfitobacter noctilucae]|uniref:nucleotidyltransferase family protein n=1 Tax=Sulfitobacter noctilucae TaxID=1342302 RepID=UPI000468ECCE|nr:nucleotidyltransferase family protein [Sulfitobacter noctilucae]KIN60887.1 4-diphosphocytidyl-2C-methyl-D-erythritol synthase [Sulfitobacter noctilucae]